MYFVAKPNTDAFNFFSAANITDTTQCAAVATLITDLKNYNLWDKIKAIYPMVGQSGVSSSFEVNLKNPNQFRGTFYGTWSFNENGATPDGSTGYMDTNFNPSTELIPSNSHLMLYQKNATSNNINGVYYGPNFFIYFQGETQIWAAIGNGETPYGTTDTVNRNGMHTVTSVNSAAKLFRNTSTIASFTAGGSFANYNVYIASGNTVNAPNTYGNGNISCVSLGLGLTDTEAINYYTAVQRFQTTLGRQV